MFSKALSTAAVVLSATQLAYAQTYTDCNPMEKKCDPDPALGTTVDVDFTKGPNDLFYEFDGTKIDYNENGAVFTINKESDAPTVGCNKFIFFGSVEVTVQAAFGQGIVTSFVLQSDNLDEIDWEWLGGDTTQVQTNYFGKGDTTTYDRGAYHNVANPQTTTHTYKIDWTKDHVQWYIDGNMVRELKYADAKGGTRFPQTPMEIRIGTWVAGRKDAPKGTVEWAGGYTDFSKGPFIAYYKEIKITDYSNGVKGAKEYVWDEGSDGSWQSIKVITGDGDDEETSSTTSSKPTSTSTKEDSSSTKSAETKTSTASEKTSSGVSKPTSSSAPTSSSSASATSGETTASSTSTPTSDDEAAETPSETEGAAPSSTGVVPTDAAYKAGSSAALMGAALALAAFLL
ncbi:hypothetical protein DL765_001678 [Monosporascus sp. GIB2]|nr:hypothetical protein DL765_001678 [Monosporascus sp. GIB2]